MKRKDLLVVKPQLWSQNLWVVAEVPTQPWRWSTGRGNKGTVENKKHVEMLWAPRFPASGG